MGSIVYYNVLLSAGIGELLFFLAAGTVLCFGFSTGIMLVAHWYLGCCWAVLTLNPGFFSFPRSGSEQVHKKLGGNLTRAANLNVPRGYSIPWSISWSVYKLGRLVRNCWQLVRDRLGTGQSVVSNCAGHHFCFLGFIPLSLVSLFIAIDHWYLILFCWLNRCHLGAEVLPEFGSPPVALRGWEQLAARCWGHGWGQTTTNGLALSSIYYIICNL